MVSSESSNYEDQSKLSSISRSNLAEVCIDNALA